MSLQIKSLTLAYDHEPMVKCYPKDCPTPSPYPPQIPKPKKFPHSKIYFAANQVVNRAPKERELLLRLHHEYKIYGIYLQYAMNIFP